MKPLFARAHAAGSPVMLMAGDVKEAKRGAESGADIIIVQGTEGGAHVLSAFRLFL